MKRDELMEKITSLCLEYLKEHHELPLKDTLWGIHLDISYLVCCMNDGVITKGARMLKENRTTMSMRLSSLYRSAERIERLCAKHGVKYFPLWRDI